MSESGSRPLPSRGRGQTRGRGGFRRTGGRDRDQPTSSQIDELEQGEVGEMKKKYSQELSQLKEMFSDWADVDLLFALEETDGDLFRTVEHISAGLTNPAPSYLSTPLTISGTASQFSDVKKKTKDRSRSKANDSAPAEATTRPPRASRTGGVETSRGRGRGDRGRASRPPRGGASSGIGADKSAPAADTSGWETNDNVEPTPEAAPVSAQSSAPAGPPKKTWASMFAPQPKSVPVQPKPKEEPVPILDNTGAVPSSDISSGYVEVTHSDIDDATQSPSNDDIPSSGLSNAPEVVIDDSNIELPPSEDKLTVDNVEHLPDTSNPAPTGTAASTVESSRGPDSTAASVVAQGTQAPIGRPIMGGYATTAYKATNTQGRSASFQRRLLEQSEAVVMPGNHAVDRATVQFGSLGLNGDSSGLEAEEGIESAETRPQPPQHSPTTQPRASLPPAPRTEPAVQELPKPAPGLPPAPQKEAFPAAPVPATGPHATGQQQPGGAYNQYSRYGQQSVPSESTPAAQKPYDPFSQPASQGTSDAYPTPTQAGQPQQHQSQLGGLSSNEYGSYYPSDQRNAYQNYYSGFGGQNAGAQQEGTGPARNGGAFGAASAENAFPGSQTQVRLHSTQNSSSNANDDKHQPNRFADSQQSGHNTPNPPAGGQQSSQHNVHQPHSAQNQHGYYGGHPYYNAPYYQAYMNQYGYGGQAGFSGQFGKGQQQMYGGQPHHGYGMPQSSYDQHSSSPAVAGGFGGETGLRGTGLASDYSRSGSAQPAQSQPHSTAGGFGNMQDMFGRSPGSFPSQAQQFGQQSSSQQGAGDDSLKALGDKTGGPSPNAIQPGRPSSTTNQAGQSGLPPPQSHQGFGGYPSQLGAQGAQASQQYGGGLSNLGGHQGNHQAGSQQSHQGGAYGSYGSGGFGSYNNQSYGRGWGGQYTSH